MNKRGVFLIAFLMAFALFQIFFVKPYWNDKTSTAVSVTERMYAEGSIVAPNLPCYGGTSLGTKTTWAEEPPVFHAIGIALKAIGFDQAYVKLLSVLSSTLLAAGIFALVAQAAPSAMAAHPFIGLSLVLPLPFLYIHFARYLPDTLMAAFLAFFLLSWQRRNYALAILLAFLAVTTKATAIFAIGSAWLAYALFSRDPLLKRAYWGAALLSSVIPMVAWLYFLFRSGTDNPFFSGDINLGRHTGGSDFHIVFTSAYWARFFTWVVTRGVSIPLFLTVVITLFRWRRLTEASKFLAVTALGIVPYWIVVRGPQFSAPYYSFPFLVPLAALAIAQLLSARKTYWAYASVAALILTSAGKLEYSLDPDVTLGGVYGRPIQLSCARQGIDPAPRTP